MSFISSYGNNNYANRCDAKQGKNQRWQWRGEKAQQQKEREGEAVSAACLSKATPFAVSHFFAMARTIFYGQACQICRMRQLQV